MNDIPKITEKDLIIGQKKYPLKDINSVSINIPYQNFDFLISFIKILIFGLFSLCFALSLFDTWHIYFHPRRGQGHSFLLIILIMLTLLYISKQLFLRILIFIKAFQYKYFPHYHLNILTHDKKITILKSYDHNQIMTLKDTIEKHLKSS